MDEKKLVEAAVAKFPAEFGLRNFPGQKFRVNDRASYFSGFGQFGEVQVVLQVFARGQWIDFTRDSERAVLGQVVKS